MSASTDMLRLHIPSHILLDTSNFQSHCFSKSTRVGKFAVPDTTRQV